MVNVIIHEALEEGRGIHEAKHHNIELEDTLQGYKGGHPLFPWFDTDLIVSRLHVELRKDLGSFDLIHDLINMGKWI